MKICLREVCDEKDRGSIGCYYIKSTIESLGYKVGANIDDDCDLELISIHHANDFQRLVKLPRRGKIRIVGGHPMAVNPRPIIPFADVICIGEGETWIKEVLRRLEGRFDARSLVDLPGTIVTSEWDPKNKLPAPCFEQRVPDHPPYLNRSNKGHAQNWYIELARGCPHACHYCALGNVIKYRVRSFAEIKKCLDSIDASSNRVNLLAPDAASHPDYCEILNHIFEKGLVTQFGSMRLEKVIAKAPKFKPNMLIRIGIDGLTEETRFRVGRKQTNESIIEYFRYMSERGHANFKVFMIVGYPWESISDLDEWLDLLKKIVSIERRTNAHLRIKITPLIPQPKTPLFGQPAKYDFELISSLEAWIKDWRPKRSPGWFIEQDGRVMTWRNWKRQCELVAGDETLLRRH